MDGTPDFRIAEASESDLPAIATFFWEGWRSSGPGAPGWAGATEAVMSELTATEVLRARIGGPDRRMFLAWMEDRVVGFAATRVLEAADTVELAGIVVLEEMAGRGIGTPLVDAAAAAAARAGAGEMLVKTETTNERALGFYRSRGFVDRGTSVEHVEGTSVEVAELVRALT